MVAVVVEILHLALVQRRTLDVFFRAELVIGERQRADVAHAHLDVRPLVARGQVMDVHDAEQVLPTLMRLPLRIRVACMKEAMCITFQS